MRMTLWPWQRTLWLRRKHRRKRVGEAGGPTIYGRPPWQSVTLGDRLFFLILVPALILGFVAIAVVINVVLG